MVRNQLTKGYARIPIELAVGRNQGSGAGFGLNINRYLNLSRILNRSRMRMKSFYHPVGVEVVR